MYTLKNNTIYDERGTIICTCVRRRFALFILRQLNADLKENN
jgi:hypothetical protein